MPTAHPPRLLGPQWLACLLSLLFFCIAPATPVQAQGNQRVALLIGNATYSTAPLRNPPNDVREMQAALQAVGFKVQTVLNANQNQMKRAVRDFGNLAQGADVAFLYYSGHGTQANGENYLLPIGAAIEKEADYEVEAVSANALMRQIAGARPKAAIVVLDACRDNPYASVTKSTSKGLGRMDAPTGTMIAFATAPNTTASDEGHYARVLARQLKTPGLELFDVFRNTTAEVRRLSGGKQEPRVSEVSISDRIYLAGQVGSTPPPQPPPVVVPTVVSEPVPQPARPLSFVTPQLEQVGELIDGRYQILASGTEVKDTKTGLIWQRCNVGKKWDGSKCGGDGVWLNFENTKKLAGKGWRVPSKNELSSLFDMGAGKSTINQRAFPETEASGHWTSTGDSWGAWFVYFGSGEVSYAIRDDRKHVRLVR